MKGTEVIQAALKSTHEVLKMYLADLSDADILVRPVPEANHTAWQLGHLVLAEGYLGAMVLPNAHYPALPEGFEKQHTKETASSDSGFSTKAQYLELFNILRGHTMEYVGKLSDADLDKPNTSKMAAFAPTIGAHLILMANHTLMHAGQFTVVRRKLGKPVLF